ncbi:hypothetical protein EB821_04025 [Candidatus Marinimicrobia bacterium PRS2]|nr:hypothetical protein EB821_04025 [Candidatus Marinimicrobia bacterium PRS2]
MFEITRKVRFSNKDKLVDLLEIYKERRFELVDSIYYNQEEKKYIQIVKIDLDIFNSHISNQELKKSNRWRSTPKDSGIFGDLINEKREGFWYYLSDKNSHDPNRIWRIEEYKDDKLDGEQIIFNTDGKISQKTDFNNDYEISIYSFYESGELNYIIPYPDFNKMEFKEFHNVSLGFYQRFYKNGNLCVKGEYKGKVSGYLKRGRLKKYDLDYLFTPGVNPPDFDDEDCEDRLVPNRTGTWTFYNEEGSIIGEGIYDNDGNKKDGIFVTFEYSYRSDLNVIEKIETYKDGKLIKGNQ